MKVNKSGVQLKAMDDAGHGLAQIATLSAVDSDGDTYAAGAFGEQWAKILAGHNWHHIPLGKARVYEEGDAAFAELHLNLETEAGRDWHQALKFDLAGCCDGESPALQEWSYGFKILDSAQETHDGNRVRVLKKLDVFEVSPVVLGAGVGTRTLAMKSDDSTPFHEQLDAVITGAGDALTRARDLRDTRKEQGRALGLSATRLKQLCDLHGGLEALLKEADAEHRAIEQLAYLSTQHRNT